MNEEEEIEKIKKNVELLKSLIDVTKTIRDDISDVKYRILNENSVLREELKDKNREIIRTTERNTVLKTENFWYAAFIFLFAFIMGLAFGLLF